MPRASTRRLLGAFAGFAAMAACGTSKLSGQGGECFVATDCREPLVCVEQEDKSRRCTDDPSRAVGRLPPEASVPDAAGDDGGGEVEPPEAGGPAPEPDAGAPAPRDASPG